MTCEHRYRIERGKHGNKLECSECGKFYGYIRDHASLELLRRLIAQHGAVRERDLQGALRLNDSSIDRRLVD